MIQKVECVDDVSSMSIILNEYPEIFHGLGKLKNYKHHIKIDESVPPVIPPRRVPFALHDKVKKELKRMESMRVIHKVNEQTEWVSSVLAVRKPNDKVRICIDPKDLNRAIKREHYPMRATYDVVTKLPNANYFSKLDAESGFWQLELDEPSSSLLTFNTPFGKYKFLRLAFGISSSPEIFQKAMSQLFEDVEEAECIVDDILLWGETIEQHNQRLRNVLERVKQSGIKFNRSKCQIGVTEIKYIGHTLGKEGLKPDLEKVEAINNMPEPEDKAGLQRFMGMLQYVSKFIPNLSTETAPLRQLLEKNVIWNWNETHRNCYKRLKELVSSASVLRFYDVNESVFLLVDVSSTGLGAVILQNDQPVAFASKALTETQMRYAQIEKEMLAIVFGCVKFHQYIYIYIFGKTITVQTDHKPLESFMKKPLYLASVRLQKMLMKLQRYDLKVEYTKGTELYVADTLGRAHLPETSEDFDEELEVSIVLAVSYTKRLVEKRTKMKF